MRLVTSNWFASWPRNLLVAVAARQPGRGERAGAAAVGMLLLALGTFGCSTSPDDEASPAIEEPTPTTEAALPATTTQPDPPPTTSQPEPPPTTTQPDEPEPPPTTTQPDEPELPPTTTEPGTEPEDATGTGEPSTPDSDEEAAPDDTGTEPESDGSAERAPAESQDVFEPVNLAVFPELAHQRLLPWKDGFLHVGYLPNDTSEALGGTPCGFAQLRTRFSTDGMQWTEFSDLEVPSVHTKPTLLSQLGSDDFDYIECWVTEYRTPTHFSSDGEHFVIASQWPTYLDTWDGRNAADGAWLDQLLENPPSIALSITRDLVNWETIEIPIPRPDGLHASLQTAPSLVGLSLSEFGWLAELKTVTYMNLFSLMPADIRESAHRIEPKYDGPWQDESTGELGMTVKWSTDGTWSGDSQVRFVTWDELGTTSELYYDYGAIANKPYHPLSRYSGSIFVAPWGESPKQFDLPDVHICCTIWTESGHVSHSDHSQAGYSPWHFGPGEVVFSSDGETWDYLGPVAAEDTYMWVTRIAAVNSGGIAFSFFLNEEYFSGDAPDLTTRPIYWLGDTDGSNWRQIELPDGTALIEWLMANDRAPIDWPHMAVNGNIVLRFGNNGSIKRYLVPE